MPQRMNHKKLETHRRFERRRRDQFGRRKNTVGSSAPARRKVACVADPAARAVIETIARAPGDDLGAEMRLKLKGLHDDAGSPEHHRVRPAAGVYRVIDALCLLDGCESSAEWVLTSQRKRARGLEWFPSGRVAGAVLRLVPRHAVVEVAA